MTSNTQKERQRAHNRAAAEAAAMAAENMIYESGVEVGIYTDTESIAGQVLIGFARKGTASCTVLVSAQEFDAAFVAGLIDPDLAGMFDTKRQRQAAA